MPIFDVQVKRTHKFRMQIEAVDINAAATAAKQMVKDGAAGAIEWDVKFNASAVAVDPDSFPNVP